MQKLKIDFQVFLQPNITLMNLVTESSKYDGRTECILNYRQNTYSYISKGEIEVRHLKQAAPDDEVHIICLWKCF